SRPPELAGLPPEGDLRPASAGLRVRDPGRRALENEEIVVEGHESRHRADFFIEGSTQRPFDAFLRREVQPLRLQPANGAGERLERMRDAIAHRRVMK